MNKKYTKILNIAVILCLGASLHAQVPNCASNTALPLVVAMDLSTTTGAGLPWEAIQGTIVVGFDVQVIYQVAIRLGYPGISVVNIPSIVDGKACICMAIANGMVPVGISDMEIECPLFGGLIVVKYNDSNVTGSYGKGIAVNQNCCQLFVNISQAISDMAADGTLARLRNQFNIIPNSYTPTTIPCQPVSCAGVSPMLPTRNALSNFMISNLCVGTPTAPTTVTPVPGCTLP